MGFNTTVLILNDALHDIENDPEFGKNIAQAIKEMRGTEQKSVMSGHHSSAATVIECHHASVTELIAVGGNCAEVIVGTHGYAHQQEEVQLRLLNALADKLGYEVIKAGSKPKIKKPRKVKTVTNE